MADSKGKTVKMRIRSACPGLAYAQGKWYDVTETELKRLKAYRHWPRTMDEDKRKKTPGESLKIELFEDTEK